MLPRRECSQVRPPAVLPDLRFQDLAQLNCAIINSAHCLKGFFPVLSLWFFPEDHMQSKPSNSGSRRLFFLSLGSRKIENKPGLNISSLQCGFEVAGSVMEGWSCVLLCHFPAVQWSSAGTSRSPTAFTQVSGEVDLPLSLLFCTL